MKPARERRPGWGRWGGAAAVAVAAASCLFAAALWLLRTEAGAAWVLARLPGLQASGVRGALLGDLDVQRLEIALPRGGLLTIDGASWRGLHLGRASSWRPRLTIDRLAAGAVMVKPGAAAPTPTPPPSSLWLPVELQVASLQVETLTLTPLGQTPVQQVRARLQLGGEGGTAHRLDDLSLAFGRLRASGSATLGGDAPLPLHATATVVQEGALANALWSGRATLAGPLAAPRLQAMLRAQPERAAGGPPLPAQTLDLDATLHPFDAWPLGDLQAKAQGLDLSAFHPAAPATALSGSARVTSRAADQLAEVNATLDNAAPGRWNEGRLPLRSLVLALRARPDDPTRLEFRTLQAELGSPRLPAGRVQGQGHWSREGWALQATLAALQPERLDARAPTMRLDGPLTLSGSPPGAVPQAAAARGELAGTVLDRGRNLPVRLQFDGEWQLDGAAERIVLRSAQASAGGARATLAGDARRNAAGAPWQLEGRAALADFDPASWWRGQEDSPWRRGPHKLNARAEFDLTLPTAAAGSALDRLARVRGEATLAVADSQLAGVPLRGRLTLRGAAAGAMQATLKAELDGNRVDADGRLVAGRSGAEDRWEFHIAAPALAKLAPLVRLAGADPASLGMAGSLDASVQARGRWPDIASTGRIDANLLRAGSLQVQRGTARWQAGTALDAPVDAELELAGLTFGTARIDSAQLRAQGSGRAHRLEVVARSNARPPAWTDALQPGAASGSAPAPAPSQARLLAQGGFVPGAAAAVGGWRGTLQLLDARAAGSESAWLHSRDVALELRGLDSGAAALLLQPGSAEVFGAMLRWTRVAWEAAHGGAPARIDAQAEMEPLAVAPVLARLQPDFGWGGDLAVRGQLELRSAPSFSADIVLERQRGDLTVTDETGVQSLGLTDLRFGLNVADGTWSFTQGLAGSTVGVAAGAFVARTSPQATWPPPDTPVSGVLELQVANLGTWGPWVPAGWRLGGALSVSAGIGGRFGAPEYTGAVRGRELSVRNFLQGVHVSDGEVAIALQGDRARIERFGARAGDGTLELRGDATLGATPQARLQLEAQRFQLLGRVDRRIVVSGRSQLQLDRDKLRLDGTLGVDEGLIDFTRSDAPSLSDDVVVTRRPTATTGTPPRPTGSARMPSVELDLRVDLGERLRVRGRGLETGLEGELRLTSPGGKLAVNGTVRAADGTYAAYGQKLQIDRGNLVFSGPAENPRLDIEATRPNLDVRVGVAVTGSALNPRVRLFSEPEMSDLDKLSWLVLGRASEGLGRADTVLLQRAAIALLSGGGQGPTGPLTKAIGLDELSVRQSDDELRETVVSLGKQLSRRWYVGYERSLNATAGTWQLIYRIAQRFTLRAQSGEDSALDVIWTWRWN
ncbi:translocation/assembly module TamB domain-containing protein [uncultured Piscinibacter sp.]|mgnify:CR=1 FL=1|uniref:translocation/assembly module TamB domain-containing protein n=1 Tax=uncultured Piscinibacter sp. TaxID=1131835 RepID=UPI00262F86E3|nr:translocation/assembly module TamB domain-containing protein [uncultured Piscinibacter sp.]